VSVSQANRVQIINDKDEATYRKTLARLAGADLSMAQTVRSGAPFQSQGNPVNGTWDEGGEWVEFFTLGSGPGFGAPWA
jgi:hypothetical protein